MRFTAGGRAAFGLPFASDRLASAQVRGEQFPELGKVRHHLFGGRFRLGVDDLAVESSLTNRMVSSILQRERNRLALPVLTGDGHASVVAVDDDVASFLGRAAGVAHRRDVFHLQSELLADLQALRGG